MVAFRAGAEGHGTTAAPQVTVPATAQVGDVCLLHFSQNNTDVVTGSPSGIGTAIHTDATSASFPNKLFLFVVDGTTIAAGTVLSWTLSATRQWAVSIALWSGIDPVSPLIGTMGVSGSSTFRWSTTVSTIPSYTTSEDTFGVEVASDKSNGATITGYTAIAAGYTQRALAPSSNTFGGTSIMADRDAGISVGSGNSLGGETYTPNQASGVFLRYFVPLRPLVANNYTQSPSDGVGVTDSLGIQASGWTWGHSVGVG